MQAELLDPFVGVSTTLIPGAALKDPSFNDFGHKPT